MCRSLTLRRIPLPSQPLPPHPEFERDFLRTAAKMAAIEEKDRQTSMQFCNECNNLMYPKEVRDYEEPLKSKLVYVCKAPKCHVSARKKQQCQIAESTMVWKHVVKHQMAEDDIVHMDITQDPTLPRTRDITCSKCKAREAVYIQALTGPSEGQATPPLRTHCYASSFAYLHDISPVAMVWWKGRLGQFRMLVKGSGFRVQGLLTTAWNVFLRYLALLHLLLVQSHVV